MDVFEFLIQDHHSLKTELREVEDRISESGLRERIRDVMAHYQLHEEIEDAMLSHLEKKKLPKKVLKAIDGYEKDHQRLWNLYEHLTEAMSHDVLFIKRDFFIFYAAAIGHMQYEEMKIFPLLEKVLERDVSEKMGEKAAMRLVKFRTSE